MQPKAAARLIFVNRFFFPDHSATSQILSDLAFALAARGWDVHVITSRQIYDDPSANLSRSQQERGVTIHRVRTSRLGRKSLFGRALDYATFYLAAFFRTVGLVRRGDVLIAKTDPPLISVPIAVAAGLRRARLVNWLQDLYPEVAIALGVRGPPGGFGIARWARDRSLRSAAVNVAISELMAERIRQRIPAKRVEVISNWTDDEALAPLVAEPNQLRHDWKLEDRFVVGYSGNLGRAHEIDTVLGAAEELRTDERIVFLFVGGGHLLGEMKRRAEGAKLTNIRYEPYQPRERLSESLSAADTHWLALRPELEGLIFPSKFYGIAAVARPMIMVGDPDGEIARLLRDHDCGFAVEPGHPRDFADAVMRLRDDPGLRHAMGQRARDLVLSRHSKRMMINRWEALLSDVAGAGRP